ncbi:MAG TPA: ABC transporter permease [Chitinophagaceae bacterium]|nr:ABC transporter permease [Chitinophagaceae bacterium]
MTTLMRVEWLKMRKYNAFWWIMGVTALSYPGINYMVYFVYKEETSKSTQAGQLAKMALGDPFTFPEAWHTVAFLSSLFVFIPAVVVIMLICNEYTFKTHRQNIIDGWSRNEFITSKLLDVLIISLLITLLYTIVALVTGIANQDRLIKDTWGQAKYIGLFGLQTFSQLSIAFLLGYLIRRAFLALGVFLFYYIVLENLVIGFLEWKGSRAGNYFPLQISDGMIPKPAFWGKLDPAAYQRSIDAIPEHVVLTIILTSIIWGICYWVNRKRDLK